MPTAYQSLILAESSLLHYWMVEELSGTTLIDSKGANSLACHGTPSFDQTKLGQSGIPAGGKSVQFAGTGTTSDYASTVSMTVGSDLSLEGWIYLTTNPGAAQNVLNWHTLSNFGGSLYLDSSLIPQWQVIDTPGANPTISANGPLSLNTWHHIVGKAQQGVTIRMYVDGVLQTASAALQVPVIATVGKQFWFSSDASGLVGKIDEVAIYNSPLSDASVLGHYTAGLLAPPRSGGAALLMGM